MDKDLEELLEVFGSRFSLEDIASAYSKTRQDKQLAAEIICIMHGSISTAFTADKLVAENAAPLKLPSGSDSKSSASSEIPVGNLLGVAFDGQERTKEPKSKKCSASMGSISSVIGKEYCNPRQLTNESTEAKKPLKLQFKDFPISEIWDKKNPSSMATRKSDAQVDVEEFLFKMLGEGFQLDMHVIQEVLGLCGYDMLKRMHELLDLSGGMMENLEDVGMAAEKSKGASTDHKSFSVQEQTQQLDFAQSDGAELMARKLVGSPKREIDRVVLEKELLQALFDVPNRYEEAPKRTNSLRALAKPRAFGKRVVEPHKDAFREHKPSAAESQVVTTKEEDDENRYNVLRTAVKEHWNTMKEYYKAAIDAFIQGDHARAHRLLEKGQLFYKKSREANDKSCEKLFETRDDEVMSLKLHDLEPKEAVRVLRLRLVSLSGIPTIKYLRVIVESTDEDATKGARKRLIMKQLERESIKWKEEGHGQIILIQVDGIDSKRLSFAKKAGLGDGIQNNRGP